jgi:hypothetical protein
LIPRAIVVLAFAAALTGLTACQSTQDRSAELEEEGATTLLAASGLKIEKESTEVKVTSADLLTDAYGSAVVIGLHNSSGRNLMNVPILVNVLDANGKSVYSNDIPGIEPALASVPYIPAGGDIEWVNDQVLAARRPSSVKVRVGADSDSYDGSLPDIEVTPPQLEGDPVSGIEATGKVVNRSDEEQDRLLLYVIARKGGKVVAAGRGAIERLKATTKPRRYDVFFIGDPSGADLDLTQFPTLPGSEPE